MAQSLHLEIWITLLAVFVLIEVLQLSMEYQVQMHLSQRLLADGQT